MTNQDNVLTEMTLGEELEMRKQGNILKEVPAISREELAEKLGKYTKKKLINLCITLAETSKVAESRHNHLRKDNIALNKDKVILKDQHDQLVENHADLIDRHTRLKEAYIDKLEALVELYSKHY
jgi:hypothetical protein